MKIVHACVVGNNLKVFDPCPMADGAVTRVVYEGLVSLICICDIDGDIFNAIAMIGHKLFTDTPFRMSNYIYSYIILFLY